MTNQSTTSPQDAGPHQVNAEAADERVVEAIADVSLAGISVETLKYARRLAWAHGRFYMASQIEKELRRRVPSVQRGGESVPDRPTDSPRLTWKVFEFARQPLQASLVKRDPNLIELCRQFCVLVDFYGTLVAVSEQFGDPVPPATFELWLAAAEALGEAQVLHPPPMPDLMDFAQRWRDLPAGSAESGHIWAILVRTRGQVSDDVFRASVAAGLGFDAGDRLVASIDKSLQESATQSSAGGA